MTTILIDFEDRVIAADRQTTSVCERTSTISRTENGKIRSCRRENLYFTGTGIKGEIDRQYGFYNRNGKLLSKVQDKCNLCIVTVDNGQIIADIYHYIPPKWYQLYGRFRRETLKGDSTVITMGSGDDYARGAYFAGATAEEAIRVAAKLDTYTGNSVDVVRL